MAWLEDAVGCKEARAATWVAAEDPPEPFEPPAPAPDTWPARRELLAGKRRRLPERLVDGFEQAGPLVAWPRGFPLAMWDAAAPAERALASLTALPRYGAGTLSGAEMGGDGEGLALGHGGTSA